MTRALATPLLALLAGLIAAPPDAAAEDPAAWALPDATISIVFRGADTLADRVDALEARYGEAPAVKQAADALRAWTHEGIRPAARAWGDGLRLGAGLAAFADAERRVRLVIGADDLDAAKATLAKLSAQLGAGLTVTPDGLAGPMKLTCRLAAPFMVCDSGALPDAPPGRPDDLPADTWLSVRVSDTAGVVPPPIGAMLDTLAIDVTATPDHVRVRADARARDDARAQLGAMLAPVRPTVGDVDLATIHPRTPALLRLSLDSAPLIQLARPLARPPLAAHLDPLAAAWTGELTVSFVGGLTHPVFAFGLHGGDGAPIIDALAAALTGALTETDARVERTPDTLSVVVALEPDEPPTRINLRHRTLGKTLVLALGAVDLDHIAGRPGPPADLPPALTRRGTHGLWVAHLPVLLGTTPPDLVEFAGQTAQIGALTTLLGLEAHLIDGGAWILEPSDRGLALELWWSRL